jgi:predicted permease
MRRVFRLPFLTRVDRDVDDELAFHLDMRVRRLVAAGWSPDAARAEAMRQFGDLSAVRDSCVAMDQQRERTMRRVNLLSEFAQDTVFALRTLRHNLGYAAVIVVALAIGIGANTAIFTLVDALLVTSLPVKNPGELVAIGDPLRVGGTSTGSPRTDLLSYPLYKDLARENTVFSDVVATGRNRRLDVRIDSAHQELEHPRGRYVSGNYFTTLGVAAAAGRTFGPEVDQSLDAAPVATISYGYWTRRFNKDPGVIGKTILVNSVRITIVGVAAEGYTGEIVGVYNDMWLPVAVSDVLNPTRRTLDDRNTSWLLAVGRLRPGATLAQAKQQVSTLLQRSIVSHATPLEAKAFLDLKPTYYVGEGAKGFSRVRSTFHAPLLTLMIGVALLLCIICANVANLMLARSIARGRELSVRQALGAGRSRLVRQLLTESMVLAVASAGAGLLFAWWGSRTLLRLASAGQLNIGMNLTVLGFTLGVSLAAVALFGLLPAIRASRFDLASSIRSGAQSLSGALGSRGQRAPLGKVLIASQVMLSVVLLAGATMLARSLRNTQATDIGVDRDHLVIVDVDVLARGYRGAALGRLAHDLRDRIAAIPGIAAVGFSENGVFSGTENSTTLQVPGFVARSVQDTVILYDHVSPAYFAATGTRLIAGRELTAADENHSTRVVVVNESFAKFYFPNAPALGRFFRSDSALLQIVGVVGDIHQNEIRATDLRRMYLPYVHTDSANQPQGLRVVARAAGDPSAVVQQIRQAVLSVDASLPIDGVDPLSGLMARSIAQERLVAQLATAFGVLALLLAAIGLYGLMTYTISRRTREIGLRVALGAQRGRVLQMVLVDAMRLVVSGLAAGIVVAYLSTRLLGTQLNGVKPGDPVSMVVAGLVLLGTALVAALLPALRAARVDPLTALRAE